MQTVPFNICKAAAENALYFTHRIAELPILVSVAQIARPSFGTDGSVDRAQLPQPRHRFRHQGERQVDVFRGVLLPQAEADAGSCAIGSQPHGMSLIHI